MVTDTDWQRAAEHWQDLYEAEVARHKRTQQILEDFQSSLGEAGVTNLRLSTQLERTQRKLHIVTEGLVGARESADAALNDLINAVLEEKGDPVAGIEKAKTGD